MNVSTMKMPEKTPFFAYIDKELCVVTAMRKEMEVLEISSQKMKMPFPGQVEIHMNYMIIKTKETFTDCYINYYTYPDNQNELKTKYPEYLI